jgi:hypothetical protein
VVWRNVAKGVAVEKTLRVCLDGEMISVRIALFGLVVDNSVRLVISREM